MKTDYPELEGKECTIYYGENDTEKGLIVAGCCYDVGITLVSATKADDIWICINRKEYGPGCVKGGYKLYKERFDYLVKHIKQGTWNQSEMSKDYPSDYNGCRPQGGTYISPSRCAFRA